MNKPKFKIGDNIRFTAFRESKGEGFVHKIITVTNEGRYRVQSYSAGQKRPFGDIWSMACEYADSLYTKDEISVARREEP